MDFFNTRIAKSCYENVKQVLDSTFVSEGKVVMQFEDGLSQKFGMSYPVAVNSGTSALHLALALLDVGEGDEVILPAQTFIATGMAIKMQGAVPIFADIQYDTGNLDPNGLQDKITDRTRAIIPVHWGGYPCDMDEINSIAAQHKLHVIEDAAHAFGAAYKTKPIGSISEITMFSFQAIKHLTTGDGGALCFREESDYKKAKILRWFGIDREGSKPSILGEREFDVSEIGYKYHMNDIAASIGLGNLEGISDALQRRKDIADIYRNELSSVPGLKLLSYKDDRKSSYWLFTMLVDKREDFIIKLKESNIPSSVVHLRIDKKQCIWGACGST